MHLPQRVQSSVNCSGLVNQGKRTALSGGALFLQRVFFWKGLPLSHLETWNPN
ncbi:hypothetical protein JCM18905_3796 [Vibrio sp. JCM 18905]|nr:hypothetical protein JCM18905_3796 [Vibrio sp. JCM 18905]